MLASVERLASEEGLASVERLASEEGLASGVHVGTKYTTFPTIPI